MPKDIDVVTDNKYLKRPPAVAIYDPEARRVVRTYVFIGDVPRAVAAAVTGYKPGSREQAKILQSYYGDDYRRILHIDGHTGSHIGGHMGGHTGAVTDDPAMGANAPEEAVYTVTGSNDAADILNIERLLESAAEEGTKHTETPVSAPVEVGGVIYVTDVHIYPEDKFSEFRQKIFLGTGVPVYRQHMFIITHNRVWLTYHMYIMGGMMVIDARRLGAATERMFGCPIDLHSYDSRDDIKIESRDEFMLLNEFGTNIYYIVDLAQYMNRARTQIIEAIRDPHQFDMLYYGFVVKYWPQLTPECFRNYIMDESIMAHMYPDLAPSKASLQQIYYTENSIADYNYTHAMKASYLHASGTLITAITVMIGEVLMDKCLLHIRNMFDRFEVSPLIPEIHAYVEREGKEYLLRKKHIRNATDIPFPGSQLMKRGLVMAISVRQEDQVTHHSRTAADGENRYIYLNIQPNDRYYIRAGWNEEEETQFSDVVKTLKRVINPIIQTINGMGKYVFLSGESLPLVSEDVLKYKSLNVCLFWKRVVPVKIFKMLKAELDEYIRGRIIATRPQQQADRYEFTFRKGMYDFDTETIVRVMTAAGGVIINNYYAHYSDNVIKHKWDQNYDGRVVRVFHRTTDIKYEIQGVRRAEFAWFYFYIAMYIYKSMNSAKFKGALAEAREYKEKKLLRRLKEEDPELYNLKKHGSDATYSSLCQHKMQPFIYTSDEVKNMPAKTRAKLVKYWNFTLREPAYYTCPSRAYPHLYFQTGKHPKKYCLPCCGKASGRGDSKKARLAKICLQEHKYDVTETSSMSRHIFAYGKNTMPGRMARLPAGPLWNILYASLAPRMHYLMYSVPQAVVSAGGVGLVFAAADAINVPIDKLARGIVYELNKPENAHLYGGLLRGNLDLYFSSMQDLCDTITEVFIKGSFLTKETKKFYRWPDLFAELLDIFYHTTIIAFNDIGTGEFKLFIPDAIRASIGGANRHVVVIRREKTIYPLYLVNEDRYNNSGLVEKKVFKAGDPIVNIVSDMMEYHRAHRKAHLDASTLTAAVKSAGGLVRTKYANKRGHCYLLEVEISGKTAGIPVEYSPIAADGVAVSHDQYHGQTLYADVIKVLEALAPHLGPLRVKLGGAVVANGRTVGVRCEAPVEGVIYCNGITESAAQPLDIGYDPRNVNQAIMARAKPTPDSRQSLLGKTLYENHLYQLFLVEFMHYLGGERNKQLRGTIYKLVNETNLDVDMIKLSRTLLGLIPNRSDMISVVNVISRKHAAGLTRADIIAALEGRAYDFDRITINKVRSSPREEAKAILMGICKDFTEYRPVQISGFPNVFIPCSARAGLEAAAGGPREQREQREQQYCAKHKLVINVPLSELVDILLADLENDLKVKYLLSGLFADNVLNYFKFTARPTEIILIYKLN